MTGSNGWRASPWVVRIGGLASVAIGAGALAAYAVHWRAAVSLLPGWPPVAPMTCLGLIAISASLGLLGPEPPGIVGRWLGRALAALVAAGALVILGEHALGGESGLGRLLFADTAAAWFPGGRVGQPPPQTALALLLLAVALLILDLDAAHGHRPAQMLAPAAAVIVLVSALDRIYGLSPSYQPGRANGPAAATVVAVLILAVGILASRPDGVAVRVSPSLSAPSS